MSKKLLSYFILAIASIILIAACNSETQLQNDQQKKVRSLPESYVLQIWWDKGFSLEEDQALEQIIDKWEQESGKQVNLSFYNKDELPETTQRAIQAGTAPDLVMGSSVDREINARLAWSGKLVEVSDIIDPVKDSYTESALEAVNYFNNLEQTRGYYGVPISQLTIHIFYWRDLLAQAGKSDADIPQDWHGFWKFWQEVQDNLEASSTETGQNSKKVYGLGFPLSTSATDTYFLFEQILEANNIRIFDKEGELIIEQPEVRQGIIDALQWYTDFYTAGYIPPNAINWLNPDNNSNLLKRAVVMTPNTTLSIPAAVRKDTGINLKQLGIIEFPQKPNNDLVNHLVAVNSVILLSQSQNQEIAKDFLRYLVKPDTLSNYLEVSGGRYLPVINPVWETLGWENSTDEHFATAAKTVIRGKTRPLDIVTNPAYTVILQKNIWGQALNRISVDHISPEQAADQAIAEIKTIFKEWSY